MRLLGLGSDSVTDLPADAEGRLWAEVLFPAPQGQAGRPTVMFCFRHAGIQGGRLTTGQVLDAVYARARVGISDVVLGGRERLLRACVTSFHTNEADIER